MHKTRPKAPEFDARHFRKALSQFATGVTIITTRLHPSCYDTSELASSYLWLRTIKVVREMLSKHLIHERLPKTRHH